MRRVTGWKEKTEGLCFPGICEQPVVKPDDEIITLIMIFPRLRPHT
ncbi:hypothetical protein ABIB80_006916 [Bradyrhizobium sp. i1.15.2]